MEEVRRTVADVDDSRRLSQSEEADVRGGHVPDDHSGRAIAYVITATFAASAADDPARRNAADTSAIACKRWIIVGTLHLGLGPAEKRIG